MKRIIVFLLAAPTGWEDVIRRFAGEESPLFLAARRADAQAVRTAFPASSIIRLESLGVLGFLKASLWSVRRGCRLMIVSGSEFPPRSLKDALYLLRLFLRDFELFLSWNGRDPERIEDIDKNWYLPTCNLFSYRPLVLLAGAVLVLSVILLVGKAYTAFSVFAGSVLLVEVAGRLIILKRRKARASRPGFSIASRRCESSSPVSWFDPVLGVVNAPSCRARATITLASGESMSVLHVNDSKGRRVTSAEDVIADERPVIALFGCSFLFGFMVEDRDTFAWRLQEKMPEYRIYNHGVCGYSAWQAFLAMKKWIPEERPLVSVYCHFSAHDVRNITSGGILPPAMFWSIRPRCFIDRNGRFKSFPPLARKIVPFSGSCFCLRLMQHMVNRYHPPGISSARPPAAATAYIMNAMNHYCAQNDSKFLVFCLDAGHKHFQFLQTSDLNWCQAECDFQSRVGMSRWAMIPFDTHPSPAAHSYYAELIETALRKVLSGETPVRHGTSALFQPAPPESVLPDSIYPLY